MLGFLKKLFGGKKQPDKTPMPEIVWAQDIIDANKEKLGNINFIALNFQLANEEYTSVCEIGIAMVENGEITKCTSSYVRPTPFKFKKEFVEMHDINKYIVEDELNFGQLWGDFKGYIEGKVIVGHNVNFVLSCLYECCEKYKIDYIHYDHIDTVSLAQRVWKNQESYKLYELCKQLHIDIRPGSAAYHAKACADLVLLACVEKGVDNIKDLKKTASGSKIFGASDSPTDLDTDNLEVFKKEAKFFAYTQSKPIKISFKKSQSKKFEQALSYAKKQDTFTSIGEGKDTIYTAIFDLKDYVNSRYMLYLVSKWRKNIWVEVEGKQVKVKDIVYAILLLQKEELSVYEKEYLKAPDLYFLYYYFKID